MASCVVWKKNTRRMKNKTILLHGFPASNPSSLNGLQRIGLPVDEVKRNKRSRLRRYFTLLWICCLAPLQCVAAHDASGFSEQLTFTEKGEDITLSLTGVAERSVLFFDVYTLAHYSTEDISAGSDKQQIYNDILESNTTKQISILFNRDLKAKQIAGKLSDGVQDNCADDEFQQIESDLALFKNVINQDVKKNDKFSLRWLHDGRLIMLFHGEQVGELDNPLLAKLLWSIWFGEQSVVNRKDLVQNLLSRET